MAKYAFQSIEKIEDWKFNDWELIFDAPRTSTATISVLKNVMGIYTGEVYMNGDSITKIWNFDK